MSLNDILGSALSGLGAAQAGLRTVSNNIANVGVAGYARERVSLATGVTAGRVSGVVVGEADRIADRFLEATVFRRAGDMGRSEVTADYLDRLQALLGSPSAESGLPARLDAVAAAAVAMTGAATSREPVAAFVATVGDAVSAIQQLDGDVAALRADVETEVGYSVERVNGLLARIHDLNGAVARLDGLGRTSAGAADQRMAAIEELSGLIAVTVREQPDGRVSIDTAGGATLLDRRLRQLSYPMPGDGVSQPVYPVIDIRLADAAGRPGPATGDRLDSAAAGGKLGGLIDLRDRMLPEFADKLGTLFGGLASALNAVANAGTAAPAPRRLEGGPTALAATDRHGFTGAAVFAVTAADGTLVATTRVDFDALGPAATVADALAAIEAGLGGAATASFSAGRLTIAAAAASHGVAVAQDATAPSARAGAGFAQFFGLNDLIVTDRRTLTASGFAAADPHGFLTGQTVELVLRDASGRALTRATLEPATGGSFADLVSALAGGPLGAYGAFSLDEDGRVRFDPDAAVPGATLTIPSDSTDRLGTGRSFSSIAELSGAASGLRHAEVRPALAANAGLVPLARLQQPAAVGEKAIGPSDLRGATAFVDALATPTDLGGAGLSTVDRYAGLLLGSAGTAAAQAADRLADATARRDDAVNRRDSFSGVNIDEELAQMVVLQNSYSASARVMTTASQMYDVLIGMMG